MTRQVLTPVGELAPHVRHVMVGGFEGCRVHLPACADVQLLVYLRGGALLVDPAGAETRLAPVFLVGAVNHPRLYRVEPGSRFVAVTFRPGGLNACLGMSAAELTGRIVPWDGDGVVLRACADAGEVGAEGAEGQFSQHYTSSSILLGAEDQGQSRGRGSVLTTLHELFYSLDELVQRCWN